MAKIPELTDLKVIAIILLFVAHSNLEYVAHPVALGIQIWLLSAFFFVSGYLTCSSFCKRGQSIRALVSHKFVAVYVPYVLIMAFYLLADNIVRFTVEGFLSHASFLSLFAVYSEGQYAMYQFWFIPELLVFTILLVTLHKYVKNGYAQAFILTTLFIFNLINYAYLTPLRFERNFGLYLFVFAAGYQISKRNLIQKLYSPKIAFSMLATATVVGFSIYSLSTWDIGTITGRVYYYSYTWLINTVFTLTSIITLLTFLSHLHRNLPKNKMFSIVGLIGSCTLYLYLWEGYISPRVGRLFFNEGWYYDIAGYQLLPSIMFRITFAALVAYGTYMINNKLANKLYPSLVQLNLKLQKPNRLTR